MQKLIDPPGSLGVGDEGSFGKRPEIRGDLTVDDVLVALRLFRHTDIRSTGHAIWTDSPLLSGGTSFLALGQWPYSRKLELSDDDVPHLLELWTLLEEGAAISPFSIHRLAFERATDRIVDLVIAAEALFLSDSDDHGELQFRFAVRAAKFIEHPTYGEHDVF